MLGIKEWGEQVLPVKFKGLDFAVEFTYNEIQKAIESGAKIAVVNLDSTTILAKEICDRLQLPMITVDSIKDVEKALFEAGRRGCTPNCIILDSIPYTSIEEIRESGKYKVEEYEFKDTSKKSARDIHESKLPQYTKLNRIGGKRWH